MSRRFPAVKFKNGGVGRGRSRFNISNYAVLNVRNEVKIVFQIETNREIFDQSCKVYFIAFQVNQNELKAAYRVQTRVHVIS